MVIPTPSEGSEATSSALTGGIGGVGVTATAAMPIPTSHNISIPCKLSSSAPGDKLIGFDLDLLTTSSQLSSSSQGISSHMDSLVHQALEANAQSFKKHLPAVAIRAVTPAVTTPKAPTISTPITMDLDASDKVMESGARYRRKYTDPELPPHLSEYSERNVIAILNRCDPERGRRCYSCGYDNTDKWLSNNQNQFVGYNYGGQQRGSVGYEDEPYSWTVQHQMSQGAGAQPPQQPPQPQQPPCWNYNYFESDTLTNTGYYNNSFHIHNQQQQQNMNTSENGGGLGDRKRFYSDGGSGSNTNSDLDLANAMDDEEVFTFDARLLSEAFLSSGRVDHTIQLMAYHPDYLEIFLKTHHFLMRGDGPLPYNHRNYIAIMAAARYQCSYLMELQKREFLYQGGDPKWLRGLDSAPAKLLALYNINKIMAHRPWVLRKEDFLHLTKKAGWSVSEVVQAVVILAHFHALSSFIHGCGITPEIDFDKGHSYMDPGNFNSIRSVAEALHRSSEMSEGGDSTSQAPEAPQASVSFAMDQPTSYFGSRIIPPTSTPSPAGKQTKSILKKTEVGSSSTPTANNNSNSNNSANPNSNLLKDASHHNNSSPIHTHTNSPPRKGLGCSVSEVEIIMATMKNLSETSPIEDPEERKKRFENVASSDDSHEKENLLSHSLGKSGCSIPPEISPFVCDPDFIYEDFAKRGQVSEMHTFRIQDYSWEEHGFSLVNRLYTEVGVYLDEKFKVTQCMTYYTMGGRAHVDTTKFRTAVWNYIQCLYGIRHDDYDYGEVNQLLERPLKAYIKTVCCYPERITKADYDNVMREFKHSEKVHVNLMIMEAKIQAELLYALRTIMRFLI